MQLEFVVPTVEMKQPALDFRDCFYAAGEKVINGSGGLDFFADFETWLENIRAVESGQLEGLVPSACIRFARQMDTGQILGVLDIRPALPHSKLHFGHLGYATLPGRRGKGVATAMVRWGTQQLRQQGVGDILASVYANNAPSIKVLEKCGFLKKGSFTEAESGKEIIQYINIFNVNNGGN